MSKIQTTKRELAKQEANKPNGRAIQLHPCREHGTVLEMLKRIEQRCIAIQEALDKGHNYDF
jgi:hypothetical protein